MLPPIVAVICLVVLAAGLVRPALVVRWPRSVLALIGVVSLAALCALVRLDPPRLAIGVDPATEPMISRSEPGVPGYEQAILDFGDDDLYVVVMEVAGEGDVFARRHLEVLHALTHSLRRLPGVARVESLARVAYVHHDAQWDALAVDRFMVDVPGSEHELAALRARALAEPLYRKTLVSADGRSAAINLTFQPMTDTEFARLGIDSRIRTLLDEAEGDGRRFYVGGRPHVRARAFDIIVHDLVTLVPIAVLVAAFAVWLMSGSLSAVVIPLAVCVLATLWTFGLMAVLGMDINIVLLVLGPMMICLGSVYGVHVHARARLIAATQPDAVEAALETARYSRTPVLMAGVTTCVGFGALLLNDVPATNQLGALAICGIGFVVLLSLTGQPAALALLDGGAARAPGAGTFASRAFERGLGHLLGALERLAVGHATAVLVFWAALAVGATAMIPRIVVDTDFISFFRPDARVRTDFEAVNRLLSGTVPIYVVLSGPGEGAFREPTALRTVVELQQRLEQLPGVNAVLSSVDLVRRANQAMHGDDPGAYRIPDTRAGVAEATFALPKADLRRFSTSNHGRTNLIVLSGQAGSARVRALERRIRDVLAEAELPAGFTAEVTGNTLLLNRSSDGVASNQLGQVGFAAGAILLLILAVFRSPRIAMLSMIPNVVPVLMYFGALGLGLATLSLPTGLIGCIALGIAIDDTMHFLVAYRIQRGAGLDAAEASRHCIRVVGPPIVTTSLMLIVGFLVMLVSGFATLQEFGVLTAMTMGICLSTDLMLLPALLTRLRA